MIKRTASIILLLLFALLLAGFSLSGVDRIMLRMDSQNLQRGKRVDVQAEMFYEAENGRLVTNYISPVQQVMITNNRGELAIYNERDNTVYRDQSMEYSSENNLIYFFLSGRMQDLGLRQMGFDLMETEFIDGLVKTSWFPPPAMYHLFNRIELVHEDFLPIYAGYYDAGRNLVKKVYYTDYMHFPELILPMTITEFNYLPGGDSIVNRLRFSDVRINQRAASPWFNFSIPDDANILK
jgi:hypothetical protein